MMNRRAFIALLGGSILAAPLVVEAQQTGRVYRVGVLHPAASQTASTEAFQQSLRILGYVEGQTLKIEWRWAEGKPERYRDLAIDLVRSVVDVIVAAHSQTALAARHVTQTTPIVVAGAGDAVVDGVVVSLARPGGNITGVSLMVPDLVPKRLQLLKEVTPAASRVGLLWNPEAGTGLLKAHEEAARALGLESRSLAVRTPEEFAQATQEAVRSHCAVLVAVQNPIFSIHRTRIAQLALQHRLPLLSGEPLSAEAGALMMYGASLLEAWRRAATFVDKILKGAKPAELPVEQPTRFELVINLKTAKALGLTIPQSILLRADQVIE
jgi:putative tryptophan/tyrosine transport system substrate-binding protein